MEGRSGVRAFIEGLALGLGGAGFEAAHQLQAPPQRLEQRVGALAGGLRGPQ